MKKAFLIILGISLAVCTYSQDLGKNTETSHFQDVYFPEEVTFEVGKESIFYSNDKFELVADVQEEIDPNYGYDYYKGFIYLRSKETDSKLVLSKDKIRIKHEGTKNPLFIYSALKSENVVFEKDVDYDGKNEYVFVLRDYKYDVLYIVKENAGQYKLLFSSTIAKHYIDDMDFDAEYIKFNYGENKTDIAIDCDYYGRILYTYKDGKYSEERISFSDYVLDFDPQPNWIEKEVNSLIIAYPDDYNTNWKNEKVYVKLKDKYILILSSLSPFDKNNEVKPEKAEVVAIGKNNFILKVPSKKSCARTVFFHINTEKSIINKISLESYLYKFFSPVSIFIPYSTG
ncbi:MAG: hypothetical protein IKZ04_04810 [Spirochaetaceae bacterium]|nr:hypothetical protein [Spirochaetaceae bacterium]